MLCGKILIFGKNCLNVFENISVFGDQMASYFRPKRFEEIRGRSIYTFLGVSFFKKYLLLTDLIFFRLRNKKQMDITNKGLLHELKRLEWQTQRDEATHLVFIVLIAVIVLKNWTNISLAQFITIFLLNLYANVFPIFVQRHNRMRLLRVLTKLSG